MITYADITDGIKGAAFNYAALDYANQKAAAYTSGNAERLEAALRNLSDIPRSDLPTRVSMVLAALARADKAPFHEVDFLSVSKHIAERLSPDPRSIYTLK